MAPTPDLSFIRSCLPLNSTLLNQPCFKNTQKPNGRNPVELPYRRSKQTSTRAKKQPTPVSGEESPSQGQSLLQYTPNISPGGRISSKTRKAIASVHIYRGTVLTSNIYSDLSPSLLNWIHVQIGSGRFPAKPSKKVTATSSATTRSMIASRLGSPSKKFQAFTTDKGREKRRRREKGTWQLSPPEIMVGTRGNCLSSRDLSEIIQRFPPHMTQNYSSAFPLKSKHRDYIPDIPLQ